MIDHEKSATLNDFTMDEMIDYLDMYPKTRKFIVSVCDECGKERIVRAFNYHGLCGSCSSSRRWNDPNERKEQSKRVVGYFSDQSNRDHMSEVQKNRWISLDERKIASDKTIDWFKDPQHREEASASAQGILYEDWEGFACESLYCPAFNEKCKESNREQYARKCFLTGLPESENVDKKGKQWKLSVHHVDMDKGQGCNGKKWKLVPLCMSWHRRTHNELWEARIIWLLDNVWE